MAEHDTVDTNMAVLMVSTDVYGYELGFDPAPSRPEVATRVVTVVEYDPTWPDHFQQILQKLKSYLNTCNVAYLTIEHVGSTAVPGLAAKPNIDVIIEVPDQLNAEAAKEALTHEPPAAEHYKCIGDGGVRGRISMKLHDRSKIPDQSVYVSSSPAGPNPWRLHFRSLTDPVADVIEHSAIYTLTKPEHGSLKEEYGRTKIELAASVQDGVEYGQKKNPIIRRILEAAGWTPEEIDEKEGLDYRIPGSDFEL